MIPREISRGLSQKEFYMFKVGDKVRYIGKEKDNRLSGAVLTVTCIDERYVGFDITDRFPGLKYDRYFNGEDTNFELNYQGQVQFELVTDKKQTGWGF